MLVRRNIFGVNNVSTLDNVHFVDEDTCVYSSGRDIVLYNKITRRQSFITDPEVQSNISTFNTGNGKRIAVSVESNESSKIHIYDLKTMKKKKILTSNNFGDGCISLQISEDEKTIVALNSGNDQSISLWSWAKNKHTSVLQLFKNINQQHFHKITINPQDGKKLALLGNNCVRYYTILENEIKPLYEHFFHEENLFAISWMYGLDDHLAVGNENGEIFIIKNHKVLFRLKVCNEAISCLITYKGVLIIATIKGNFYIYSYDQYSEFLSIDLLKKENEICCDMSQSKILGMTVNASHHFLVANTEDGQLLSIQLKELLSSISNNLLGYLMNSFHKAGKAIVDLDICSRKPIMISCAKDNSIKIWNYKTNNLMFSKELAEDIFCVSLHPSGMHVAIGFLDKVRIYHILIDDLRLCLEIPVKACRECRFNRGGNFLAMANGSIIVVIDFYTGERFADLRGHNSKVRGLKWLDSGLHLLSCGQEGAIYLWDILEAKRTHEYLRKGVSYTSVSCSGEGNILITGSDSKIGELNYSDLSFIHDQTVTKMTLNQIEQSRSKNVSIVSATSPDKIGYLLTYASPMTSEYESVFSTTHPITRMKLSSDEIFLLVGDEGGNLVLYEIHDLEGQQKRKLLTMTPDLVTLSSWGDEVLVTRADLEDYSNTITELSSKLEELQLNHEYHLKLKEMAHLDKLKLIAEDYIGKIDEIKASCVRINREHGEIEAMGVVDKKTERERKDVAMHELETKFQKDIVIISEALRTKTQQRASLATSINEQKAKLTKDHEKRTSKIINNHKAKLREEVQMNNMLREENKHIEIDLKEKFDELEDEVDENIENLKSHLESKIEVLRDTILKYKGENGLLKKKYSSIEKEIYEYKIETSKIIESEKELHEQIVVMEKEVEIHRKEIKMRDAAIDEKEKKIFDLKKKNYELDCFGFQNKRIKIAN